MEYINIGKITSTHGIKGELKIKSNFKYKVLVFKKDNKLYLGNSYIEEVIDSYRVHKQYDMITFKNYNDINEVLKYIGFDVYCNKNDIELNEDYLNEDLINMDVIFKTKTIGKIIDVFDAGHGNEILDLGNIKIPKNDNFIERIDKKSKTVYVKNIEGLML